MHITELRIAGFKSFVDPETVPIEPGLTGIVGPNGCGKSNLLEALRWAMGATSARAMRGGEMDDLIFNGAAGRPARELAEVTLVLDNALRQAPAEFNQSDTLEIIRRLKRGAGSTYKLNGRTVRAKDVQLIFADASTGANSPSLVRQGQINELISSKPQNRRRILEEAAGVAGLSARRHEAELKLKAAEQNLGSLSDLNAEVERQLESLKRQARKAKKYALLSAELEALEAFLLHLKWSTAKEAIDAAAVALQEAEADVELHTRNAATLETKHIELSNALAPLRSAESEASAKVGQVRIELARVETEKNGAQQRLENLEEDCARLKAEIASQEEQLAEAKAELENTQERLRVLPDAGAEDDLEQIRQAEEKLASKKAELDRAQSMADDAAKSVATLNAERQATESQLRNLQQRLDSLTREIQRHKSDLESLKNNSLEEKLTEAQSKETQAVAALANAKQAFSRAEESLLRRREEQARLQEPFETLTSEYKALKAEAAGLERLLRTADNENSTPVVSDTRIAPGYEKALGAVIGDELSASSDTTASLYWGGATTPGQTLPQGCRPLSEFADAPAVLHARISQCGVCDAAAGPELAKLLKPGQRLVSKEGHIWRWDGFTKTPDAPSSAAERLQQQAKLEANLNRISQLDVSMIETGNAFEAAKQKTLDAERELKQAQSELNQASEIALQATNILAKLRSEHEGVSSRMEAHTSQLQRLEVDHSQLEALIGETKRADDSETLPRLERAAIEAQAGLTAARSAETEARGELADLTRNREQALQRRKAVEADLQRWQRLQQKTSERLHSLQEQLKARSTASDHARALPTQLAQRHSELVSALETAQAELKSTCDQLAERESAVREVEQALRTANNDAMRAREKFAEHKAQRQASAHLMEELDERSRTQFQCLPNGLMTIASQFIEPEVLEGLQLADAERRATEVRIERERLGGVNMEAEAEALTLQERLETQQVEQADLSNAIEKLRQGISELNGEARQRLIDAYESVNGHFKSLFKTLFRGGEAELRLVDAEDPLDAGLEIFAQPPGKRLGTLSLMSGGEQALTATALIFAVFLSRPAPICVLDEVDAPLDDANVDRFCRMLQEMRQRTDTRFVVITHNPVTMSRMDRLFGVTMREQGVSKLVSVDLNTAEQLIAAE